jgi:hypothetical protein
MWYNGRLPASLFPLMTRKQELPHFLVVDYHLPSTLNEPIFPRTVVKQFIDLFTTLKIPFYTVDNFLQ